MRKKRKRKKQINSACINPYPKTMRQSTCGNFCCSWHCLLGVSKKKKKECEKSNGAGLLISE